MLKYPALLSALCLTALLANQAAASSFTETTDFNTYTPNSSTASNPSLTGTLTLGDNTISGTSDAGFNLSSGTYYIDYDFFKFYVPTGDFIDSASLSYNSATTGVNTNQISFRLDTYYANSVSSYTQAEKNDSVSTGFPHFFLPADFSNQPIGGGSYAIGLGDITDNITAGDGSYSATANYTVHLHVVGVPLPTTIALLVPAFLTLLVIRVIRRPKTQLPR